MSSLDSEELQSSLGPIWSVEIHQSLPSTMDRAREVSCTPALVLALHQTAGRGRQGRRWDDTANDFAATFVFSRHVEVAKLMGFSLAVGLTARRALPGVPIRLKWPNDLYTPEGRKLGGILIEVVQEPSPRVLVGIGINLVDRSDTKDRAGLQEFSDAYPTPMTVAQRLAEPLAICWEQFQSHGFAELQDEFCSAAYGLGHRVVATEGNQRIEGVISGVDDQGCLIVTTTQGPQRLVNAHIEEIKKS